MIMSLLTAVQVIGASLSERHINEKYVCESYVYIIIWYVRHPRAALYKTYRYVIIGSIAMMSLRQEKSIVDHVDV